jgi:hypothetical protein
MEKHNSNSQEEFDGLEINGKPVVGFTSNDMGAEVKHNIETNGGDWLTCKNCGEQYERGPWDFHSLCPICFEAFDEQKMKGRYAYLVYKTGGPNDYFESSDEWVAAQKGTA